MHHSGMDLDRIVKRKLDNQGQEKMVLKWEVDWTKLPKDMIIRLFSCLNNRDRASLSSTCKTWWVLSKYPYLWESLDLQLYRCNVQAAKSLSSRCNNLHKLRIRGYETSASVINLEANNLREISIKHCGKITDVNLSVLVARHKALECLLVGPDLCVNISSAAIIAIALCCPNLKKLWLSGIKDVTGEAICALADNCQNLSDIGFINCGKVDEPALGKVRALSFLSVAGTAVNWNLALLHWSNLLNLVCLDVSKTDIEPSAVSGLLLSCFSLKFLCAFNCPSLERHSTSINRRGKCLVAFFTNILKELDTFFVDMPKEKGNVFLDWRNSYNFKDRKLEGVLDWLEWTFCNSLLCILQDYAPCHDNFWLQQGVVLLFSFLQSPHEEVQERAATTLELFEAKGIETFVPESGICFLVNLARSSHEGLQLESVKAIGNLSMNDNVAKVMFDEGGVDVLLNITSSAGKTMAAEALRGLWKISACDDHKTIAKTGGIRVVVDVVVKWSNCNGCELLLKRAVGLLVVLTETCSMEAASSSVVPALLKLLRIRMDPVVQTLVACCLASMVMYDDSNGNHAALGQERGALEALVQLVRSQHHIVRQEAVASLWIISSKERIREAIAAVGGVQALVALGNSWENSSLRLQISAGGLFWQLSLSEENSIAIGQEGGVTLLIEMAKSDFEDVHGKAAGALWNLGYNARNAMHIIEEDGVRRLIWICSSSVSKMARFLSVLALANMFDEGLDKLAMGKGTSKSACLISTRRLASKAIVAFLKSYFDPQAFSGAASSSLPASEALVRVTESARIQEVALLECSESDIRSFLTMLSHSSPILKSCGAFALLQVTIPGDEYMQHHANLLKKAGAPRVLRSTAASTSTPRDAKAFLRVVLKNLEHLIRDDFN